jgi:hypothetical protein
MEAHYLMKYIYAKLWSYVVLKITHLWVFFFKPLYLRFLYRKNAYGQTAKDAIERKKRASWLFLSLAPNAFGSLLGTKTPKGPRAGRHVTSSD